MPLGKDVGLGPGHIVLDGDPAPHSSPSPLSAMPIVAKRSPISATAELLLIYYKALTAGTHFDISAAPSSEYFYTWIIIEKSCSTCHSVPV